MRVLVLDPFNGAAGDMITAALIHAGADRDAVRKAMASVVAEPGISTVVRAGITACRIETRAAPALRSLDEVLARVRSADASPRAITLAERVFSRLAEAESGVHPGSPHFHEVGADDAIADVIGACTALLSLQAGAVHVLPVALGGGRHEGAHGTFPVPAPATVAILAKSPLTVRHGSAGDGELCTPTGAALLAEFATGAGGPVPAGRVIAVGYGAGSRDTRGIPNVIRAILIEADPDLSDQVDILETNVDDISGEVIGHALAAFMDAGARDATAIPCVMKKGRPGILVRVITDPTQSHELAALMAHELGSLGIRCIPSVHRFIAGRTLREVTVRIDGQDHVARVKYGMIDGKCLSVKAEFEDAAAIARARGIPLREVTRRIEEVARGDLPKDDA